MKTKFCLFALTVAALALGSCSESENGGSEAAKYITVSSGIGNMSRVATNADGTQKFTAGDKISVYAWTGSKDAAPAVADRVVDNAVNTLGENGEWVAAPQMLWKDQATPHFFAAVYPSTETSLADLTKLAYTLDVNNQTSSDLLVATSLDGVKAQNNPVQLKFDHVMAKMTVNLEYRDQFGGTPTVTSLVVKNAASDAFVNLLTKAVAVASDAARAELAFPAVEPNKKYTSVLVPQSGVSKIVITIDGKQYVYTHTSDIKLESGKETVVNLIVGRDEITLGDVTIGEWGKGETIDGGEAQTD